MLAFPPSEVRKNGIIGMMIPKPTITRNNIKKRIMLDRILFLTIKPCLIIMTLLIFFAAGVNLICKLLKLHGNLNIRILDQGATLVLCDK